MKYPNTVINKQVHQGLGESICMKYPNTAINKQVHRRGAQMLIEPCDRLLPTNLIVRTSQVSSEAPVLRGLCGLSHLTSPLKPLNTAVESITGGFIYEFDKYPQDSAESHQCGDLL